MPNFTPAQSSALKAARAGNLDHLRELLDGQDVIKDSNKLVSALRENKLLAYNDHDRVLLEYLFMASAGVGHHEMLRYLLGLYPYPGPSIPDRVIENAINSGSTETVQVLLDLNPPIPLNVYGGKVGKPLDHALSLDRRQDAIRMTEFLLQHGADPNFDGGSITYAIVSSWPQLTKLLERYVYIVTGLIHWPRSLLIMF